MSALFEAYRNAIYRHNLVESEAVSGSVTYWRNLLFANTLVYVIPFSLIALLPSIVFCLNNGLYLLAGIDFVAFGLCLYLAFIPGMTVQLRKLIFILSTYAVALVMLIHVGPEGPGLLFIYAATVFALLILPRAYSYHWSWLNIVICLGFAGMLHFDLGPVEKVNQFDAGIWLLISSNLMFLSLLCSALIPKLFDGLAETVDKLENKNTELERFAFVASHDLQEPLRMISSFMSQLDKKYRDQLDARAHQYIHFAVDGADRMKHIIQDLLDYARTDQESTSTEWVDLNEVVDEFTQTRRKHLNAIGLDLTSDQLPKLRVSRTSITQVIHNLLENAIKYSRDGVKPVIRIHAKEKKTHWELCVEDNGIGIESNYFDKIFEIFQRLHARNEYSGTGIGLAIVKKTVDLLGGNVRVESVVDEGSRFYFTLPKS